jgi:hypothetical protein
MAAGDRFPQALPSAVTSTVDHPLVPPSLPSLCPIVRAEFPIGGARSSTVFNNGPPAKPFKEELATSAAPLRSPNGTKCGPYDDECRRPHCEKLGCGSCEPLQIHNIGNNLHLVWPQGTGFPQLPSAVTSTVDHPLRSPPHLVSCTIICANQKNLMIQPDSFLLCNPNDG